MSEFASQLSVDQFALMAVSPLDGRYQARTAPLQATLSEYGLIKYRLIVEIQWLLALSQSPDIPELPSFSQESQQALQAIIENFGPSEAMRVKTIEQTTNHDLKAVEYFLKEQLSLIPELAPHLEFIHFACTSEDINNLAYGLMLKDAREKVLLPQMNSLLAKLQALADAHSDTPLLSRTHGQPASPSTMGKELANLCYRLKRQIEQFRLSPILGKINGAVGNFNAHLAAYPEADWPQLSRAFIHTLGLDYNPYTTQIEPHDYVAEYLHVLMRFNTILIDLSRDFWGYISFDYLAQQPKAGEVGSSTMPHKVNPIDFENAEGNLGLANALMDHLANKLPISRFQRDLTDSTVIRNLGACLGYTVIALAALEKGLSKIKVNESRLKTDLDRNWALLAEPIQTVMRRYGLENPYEQLKTLTRGQQITQSDIQSFISGLDIPDNAKSALMALSPETYIGNAPQLCKTLEKEMQQLETE